MPDGPQTVHLVIVDNGIGLDPEDIDRRAEGHLGLRLLKDRVENSGGTWSVTSGRTAAGPPSAPSCR